MEQNINRFYNLIKFYETFTFVYCCIVGSIGMSTHNEGTSNVVSQPLDSIGKVEVYSEPEPYDFSKFVFVSKDFESFYEKFQSDSVFQISRVKFPIKGQYQDYDDQHNWTKKEWPLMKWDFRKSVESSDSISIQQDSVKFFYGAYCRGCGFFFEMQFDKIKGEWSLTYRQENNY
ncbi:DUF4348 domain-containing protein [Sporocytophaga myxococcoides]|uniref:DUF4348 domain-containing protein n=1 Tax=Sporocytophaga myxococcoides TaxID=153721 RepID=UPI0003FF736D|nr:DUF4348 domain-containing protein [Sporocytophaga myxococcoides]